MSLSQQIRLIFGYLHSSLGMLAAVSFALAFAYIDLPFYNCHTKNEHWTPHSCSRVVMIQNFVFLHIMPDLMVTHYSHKLIKDTTTFDINFVLIPCMLFLGRLSILTGYVKHAHICGYIILIQL